MSYTGGAENRIYNKGIAKLDELVVSNQSFPGLKTGQPCIQVCLLRAPVGRLLSLPMFPKMMPFSVDDILMVALMFSNPWGSSTVGVGFSTRCRSPEQGGGRHREDGACNRPHEHTQLIRHTTDFKPILTPTLHMHHTHHTCTSQPHTSTFSMSTLIHFTYTQCQPLLDVPCRLQESGLKFVG